MFDENLPKRIEALKVWSDTQKHYILNHLYFQKIKDYLSKEYGEEIISDPIIEKEFCIGLLDTEEYNAKIHFILHYKSKELGIDSCIHFHVTYNYSIYKETGKLYESFQVYRKSDEVYLQGSGEGEYIKAYREEYSRAWQKDGFRKIPTYPETDYA